MPDLLPLFLTLTGRDVLLVGGGRVAASKLRPLLDAGARVRVVAPIVAEEIERAGVEVVRRGFLPTDVDGAWLVVAAATPEVNKAVAEAAEERRVFVNAVDDPANATAFLSGTLRREGVTIAVSTSGDAPALTALVREALEAVLPPDLDRWMAEARRQRVIWRRGGTPMAARKPKLLEALNALYKGPGEAARGSGLEIRRPARPRTQLAARGGSQGAPQAGHVSLVGAGPGDPSLLTRKAIASLRAADLVLYDALIDDRILRYARKAQRFFVGKRGARTEGAAARIEPMTQQTIHTVMIRAARRGRRVVRLKGGDPFVFGRGGEEALALRQAGVPFEVVPGVSSAVAAPELAGIPVTHRGLASAFLVVSGHDPQAFAAAVRAFPGERQPRPTLVVLMGMDHRAAIASTLIEFGWPAETPAAIVANASLVDQRVWRGTVGSMRLGATDSEGLDGSTAPEAAISGPATIIIGEVVSLAADVPAGIARTYVSGT
jgi:uroporphyrin-III C-methyltransferase / precorrin-2 dehydrogenase / sirohydrochlorin ferrochelatase